MNNRRKHILRKYIANEFILSFLFSITALSFVQVISKFFDDLRMFIDHKTPIKIITLFYLYRLPYIVVEIIPVSVLLATIFVLTKLIRTNELSAMKAGGMSLRAIATPILNTALVISLLTFIFTESVVPYSNIKSREIRQSKILKIPISHGILRDNATFITSDDLVIYTKFFNGESGNMLDVSILKLNKENRLIYRFDAKEASYLGANKGWRLDNGYEREFLIYELDENNLPKEKANKFDAFIIHIKETPADFSKGLKKQQELTMNELIIYIKKLQTSGHTFKEELVNLYLRISFPFANFILCLIGIPIALMSGRRGGVITSFAVSLAIGFIYWGFIGIGISFGKNGLLPPLLSAWLGNIIFGIIGIYLLGIVRKY